MAYSNSFQYYREKITIMEVAYELGYRHDASKGKKTPSFVLYDNNHHEMDRIYINHPNDNTKAIYWRRNPGPGRLSYGDVVQFIRENINSFSESAGARNEIDAVNKVCQRLSNSTVDMQVIMGRGQIYHGESNRTFNLDDFEREKGNWKKAMRFLSERGIDEHTAALFKDNFELIRDTKADNKVSWKNLAFPYRRPGETDIVGFEIRGFGKFKSKAEGSDSTRACWQAYLGTKGAEGLPSTVPAFEIEQIHIAESAYDVMSYVQLHQGRLDLEHSLFVSVGGTFTNELMQRLFMAYPEATPVLHFDNDITGVMYDIRAAAIKAGKTLRSTTANGEVCFHYGDKQFTVPADNLSYNQFIKAANLHSEDRPKVKIEKAPGDFKDWNEVLQAAMQAEKTQLKPVSQAPQRGSYDNPAPMPPEEADSRGFHR